MGCGSRSANYKWVAAGQSITNGWWQPVSRLRMGYSRLTGYNWQPVSQLLMGYSRSAIANGLWLPVSQLLMGYNRSANYRSDKRTEKHGSV